MLVVPDDMHYIGSTGRERLATHDIVKASLRRRNLYCGPILAVLKGVAHGASVLQLLLLALSNKHSSPTQSLMDSNQGEERPHYCSLESN